MDSIRVFPKSDAAEPSAMTLTGFAAVADPPAWDAGREGMEQNPQPVCSYLYLVFTKNRLWLCWFFCVAFYFSIDFCIVISFFLFALGLVSVFLASFGRTLDLEF